MTIKSSRIIEDAPQHDGRRHVVELHVAVDGRRFKVRYTAEEGAFIRARLEPSAAKLERSITRSEQKAADNVVKDRDQADALLRVSDADLKLILVGGRDFDDHKREIEGKGS